jgi:hypothetical protein
MRTVSRLSVATVPIGIALLLFFTGAGAAIQTRLNSPSIASHIGTDANPVWPLANSSSSVTSSTTNGLPTFPPPGGASPLVGYSGHYYHMDDYSGSTGNVANVSVQISIPQSGPVPNDTYAVLLSIYDDATAQYYDQIGIFGGHNTGSGDDWEILYTQNSNCGSTTVQEGYVDTGHLYPGFVFVFEMSLGGGYLNYTVTTPSYAPIIWTHSVPDSATVFRVNSLEPITCGNSQTGYTNYEEVYSTVDQPVPNWDFNMSHNLAGGVAAGPWIDHSDNVPADPHGYYWTQTSSNWVVLANQAVHPFQSNGGFWSGTPGQSMSSFGPADPVGPYCGGNPCYLNLSLALPSGWYHMNSFVQALSAKVTSSAAVIDVLINTPSNASIGIYYATMTVGLSSTATGPDFEYTTFVFYLLLT